ncbi:MAG: Uncharacterised protein [Owenweeksia sp. TMED14]|nr:MAG: Uncharacterised protein [Owenweeksia sp. TMED14]
MISRFFTFSKLSFILLLFLCAHCLLEAQNIVVNSSSPRNDPMWLIQNVFVGPNLTVFSPIGLLGVPKTQASSVQFGKFYINNPAFGLDSGIVMSTTDAIDAVPGQSGSYTNNTTTPSANLSTVLSAIGTSGNLFDKGIMEFSFVAPGDSVKFDYIFASKEYTDYTCSGYNDVFGFFLIGSGINGNSAIDTVNLATIPGTNVPVAINTINQGYPSGSYPASNCLAANPNYVANSSMYNPNSPTAIVNYPGFTDVFTAKAEVTCGSLYTIKLIIADVLDGSLNSAVFLGARSFDLPTISLNSNFNQGNTFNDTTVVEGCKPSYLYLNRSGAISDTMTINFNYSGNAISGVDYAALPTSVTLLPGVTNDSVPITAFDDGVVENLDTIRFVMQPVTTNCAVYPPQYKTFLITDKIPLIVSSGITQGNDTITCPGEQVILGGSYSAGQGVSNGWWGTDTTGPSLLSVNPANTTTYYYSAIDECMGQAIVDSVTIYLQAYDSIQTISNSPYPICPGESLEVLSEAKKGTPPYAFQWNNGPSDSAWTITPPKSDWYLYEVTDGCGSVVKDSVWVIVAQIPSAAFSYFPSPGYPLNVQFSNQSSDTNYVKWYFGDGDISNMVNPYHSYKLPGFYTVGLVISDSLGCQDSVSIDIELKMDYYVYVPNTFTPNGDIINDRIKIEASGIERLEWQVFNRWGLMVFSSNDMEESWDGTLNGQPSPEGAYLYKLILYLPFGNIKEKTGSFNLIR